MKRRVQLVLICEDKQQETFIRRFFDKIGWNGQIRPLRNPSGKGSGAHWVITQLPRELVEYRRRIQKAATAVVAMVDADNLTVKERMSELQNECKSNGIDFIQPDERVVVAIPKRNIETWIKYLEGENVDENTVYKKLERERDCGPSVNKLVEICKQLAPIPPNPPPSLNSACEEFNSRINL